MKDHGSSSVIVTLFEGHYHMGLAALVNSLYRHGFRGTIYAGYRGDLPPWAHPNTNRDNHLEYSVADGCSIRFVKVETPWHLTNYKPTFMFTVMKDYEPNTNGLFFFDPDIVITCDWSFFERWISFGIALCEEITMAGMPSNHPLRCIWADWLKAHGWSHIIPRNQAFNGGFVGITRTNLSFVQDWEQIMKRMEQDTPLDRLLVFPRSHPFAMIDQDGLCMTTMVTQCPLSTIGPEGMGFLYGGFTMLHATSQPKPWKKQFIKNSLAGNGPTRADIGWIAHSVEPIAALSPKERRRLIFKVKLSTAISRIWKRS